MDARPSAIDSCFQSASILARTTKIPAKFIWVSSDLLQIAEFMFLPIMPEQSLTKNEPERHFVYQCFQGARTDVRRGENMHASKSRSYDAGTHSYAPELRTPKDSPQNSGHPT